MEGVVKTGVTKGINEGRISCCNYLCMKGIGECGIERRVETYSREREAKN